MSESRHNALTGRSEELVASAPLFANLGRLLSVRRFPEAGAIDVGVGVVVDDVLGRVPGRAAWAAARGQESVVVVLATR